MRDDENRRKKHRVRFEAFEDRQALSAQPLSALAAGPSTLTPFLSSAAQLAESERFELHVDERVTESISGEGNSWTTQANGTAAGFESVEYVRANYGLTGRGQTVVVIDSGIAYGHVALGAGIGSGHRIVGGWDFAENDANPYDDGPAGFHGTHVAGIIGGSYRSFKGVATGVDLVGLRVFNDAGQGELKWVEQALQWVHKHRFDFANPITTVNLSLGTDWNANTVPSWSTLEDEFAELKSDGLFVAVSAGNSFATTRTVGLSYPAASPYVFPVASVGANGDLSDFSQRSSRVIAAPGTNITSTVPDYLLGADGVANDFASASGTSMASPYVAGSAALVREAMQRAGNSAPSPDAIFQQMIVTADQVYDPQTRANYSRLNLQRAIDTLLAAPKATDLGTVAQWSATAQKVAGESWYAFRASRTGTMTAQVSFQGNGIQMELWDPQQRLAISEASANSLRIDQHVVEGQTYRLKLTGQNSNVGVTLTNLIDVQGDQIDVRGTSNDDSFSVQLGASVQLSVNGVSYSFAGNRAVSISGGAGRDSLELTGSRESESITWRGEQLSLQNGQIRVDATNLERLDVRGGGGQDRATLFGSAGNDSFEGLPDRALLETSQTHFTLVDFDEITVDATQGGVDVATLRDSSGDDQLVMESTYSSIQGSGYRLYVAGFEQVVAIASGGSDSARFYDSLSDDNFTANTAQAAMQGERFSNLAIGFDSVVAYSRFGGRDSVQLAGTAGDDRFEGYANQAHLNGVGYRIAVYGFSNVTVDGTQGGDDVAQLFDSAGDDQLTMESTVTTLTGSQYTLQVRGFDRINAYASTGSDTARFYDGIGNDEFVAEPQRATMIGSGIRNSAHGFDAIAAFARLGGTNSAVVRDSAGNDAFVADAQSRTAALRGTGYSLDFSGFEDVTVTASSGHDTAQLRDSSGHDTFTAEPTYASMRGSGYYHYVRNFDNVVAESREGGLDRARFYDSVSDDLFTARGHIAEMINGSVVNQARGFTTVEATGRAGGNDSARLEELVSIDRIWGRGPVAILVRSNQSVIVRDFDRVVAQSLDLEPPQSDVQAVDFLFQQFGRP